MMIRKDEKEYEVKELRHDWKISRKLGAVELDYKVPKSIASTVEELEEYILTHDDLF